MPTSVTRVRPTRYERRIQGIERGIIRSLGRVFPDAAGDWVDRLGVLLGPVGPEHPLWAVSHREYALDELSIQDAEEIRCGVAELVVAAARNAPCDVPHR